MMEILRICWGQFWKCVKMRGFETELYQAGGRTVKGSMSCGGCWKNPRKCVTDDWVMEVYEREPSLLVLLTYIKHSRQYLKQTLI